MVSQIAVWQWHDHRFMLKCMSGVQWKGMQSESQDEDTSTVPVDNAHMQPAVFNTSKINKLNIVNIN